MNTYAWMSAIDHRGIMVNANDHDEARRIALHRIRSMPWAIDLAHQINTTWATVLRPDDSAEIIIPGII